jgi:hypothetical protein
VLEIRDDKSLPEKVRSLVGLLYERVDRLSEELQQLKGSVSSASSSERREYHRGTIAGFF